MQGKSQIFIKTGAVAYINEYYPFGLVSRKIKAYSFFTKTILVASALEMLLK
jgi:hypothetical protein